MESDLHGHLSLAHRTGTMQPDHHWVLGVSELCTHGGQGARAFFYHPDATGVAVVLLRHLYKVSGCTCSRFTSDDDHLVFLGLGHVGIGKLGCGEDVGAKRYHFLTSLVILAYDVAAVAGEWLERVQYTQDVAHKGVDVVLAIANLKVVQDACCVQHV